MTYSAKQVREILGLPASLIERLVEARFVTPSRGPRRELLFSFQDLVVLRAAKGLAEARIPVRRISRSLKRLREQLPSELPARGLRIAAVGDSVAVMEAGSSWRTSEGQYLMAFEVAAPQGRVVILEHAGPRAKSAEEWFEEGCRLEATDACGAIRHYRAALAADVRHAGLHVELGRLLHQAGDWQQAEAVYRQGIERFPQDPLLAFNCAVLMEERSKPEQAIELYKAALVSDPRCSDAHYNLGKLYDRLGMGRDALRHMNAYRRLHRP